jgi:hypothetical protein
MYVGEYFTFDERFSFLIVRNSGHLLPMDLPAQGLEMISRYLNNQSFADQLLVSEDFYRQELDRMRSTNTDTDSVSSGEEEAKVMGTMLGLGMLIMTMIIILVIYSYYHHHHHSKGLSVSNRKKDIIRQSLSALSHHHNNHSYYEVQERDRGEGEEEEHQQCILIDQGEDMEEGVSLSTRQPLYANNNLQQQRVKKASKKVTYRSSIATASYQSIPMNVISSTINNDYY